MPFSPAYPGQKYRNIVTGETAVLKERDPHLDISVCILTEHGERLWIMSSDFLARWKRLPAWHSGRRDI